jgi:hypothetical protein
MFRRFQRFRRQDKWIQETDMKTGALTNYLKQNRSNIRKKYGRDPFNKNGTINIYVLEKLAKDPTVHLKTRRRAQAALNLKRI